LNHQVTLHSLKYQGVTPDLSDTDVILFGAPTYDDGLLEQTTRSWIKEFHPDLSKVKVAVFGLGNKTYPQYCLAADVLEAWVNENNGQPVVEALRVDHFPDDLRPIIEWAVQLNAVLQ
jgi:flavodoxin I